MNPVDTPKKKNRTSIASLEQPADKKEKKEKKHKKEKKDSVKKEPTETTTTPPAPAPVADGKKEKKEKKKDKKENTKAEGAGADQTKKRPREEEAGKSGEEPDAKKQKTEQKAAKKRREAEAKNAVPAHGIFVKPTASMMRALVRQHYSTVVGAKSILGVRYAPSGLVVSFANEENKQEALLKPLEAGGIKAYCSADVAGARNSLQKRYNKGKKLAQQRKQEQK